MSKGSRITLTSNEVRDVLKIIGALENREFYWKELLEKIIVKKEDFSVFLEN